MNYIDVTNLSYLLEAIDGSDLDEPSKEKMKYIVHDFSNQHSVLATAVKRANKNPVLKVLDKLIPPASSLPIGTVQSEEENVTPTFASKPKAKKVVKKSKPKKNIDDMFVDIDDEILG